MANYKINPPRPSWDEVFMAQAIIASSRASCYHVQAGVVIAKNNRVLATGYNGAPPGIENSLQRGYCSKERPDGKWVSSDKGQCIGAHAETNALANLPLEGAKGGTLYTTIFPCNDCIKGGILAYGIKRVVYKRKYDPKEKGPGTKLLEEAGVEVIELNLTPKRFIEITVGHPAKDFSTWTKEEKEEFKQLTTDNKEEDFMPRVPREKSEKSRLEKQEEELEEELKQKEGLVPWK